MRIWGFAFFSVSLLILTGCGKVTTSPSPAAGPSNPPPQTTTTTLTVTNPAAGASVSSPFNISASASACQSQSISSIGYALDQGQSIQVNGSVLQTQAEATAGSHTLHVLAWGTDGSSCSSDLAITVTAAPVATPAPPSTPSTSFSVSSPTMGASVSSPFNISATASECQSQSVNSMGYSLDQGQSTEVTGTNLQTQALAAAGTHTLHVLAWGADGSSCSTDLDITVTAASTPSPDPPPTPDPPPPTPDPPAPPPGPVIPANAVAVTQIQQLSSWQTEHDTASGSGTSAGVMTLVSSPSLSGTAREFETSFTNYGGQRYHASFGSDPLATHFVYDAQIYVSSPADSIANVEMDMNQVVSGGDTIIYGFQCDGYSHTWDITENAGTPAAPVDHWLHTGATCNMQDWTTETWHHIQVAYSRDDSGNVTYESVWFDGVEQDINQTVPSDFALHWGSVLLTNLQIDGRGSSGSNIVYLDSVTVSRW